MKSLIILLSFFLPSQFINAQTWTWSSENPKAGSDLTVTVNNLKIEEDIHIVSFYFKGDDLVTSDINYIVENGALKMTLKTPESNWIRIVVKDENNQPIAGDHRDIVWAGAPSKSSLVDFANATAAYHKIMGLNRNEGELTAMYRDAISANPKWLDDPTVLRTYYKMAKASAANEDLARVKSHLSACEAAPTPVDHDVMITAIKIAQESGDTILHKSLRKKLDETYPQSLLKQEEQFAFFSKAPSGEEKIKLRDQFKSTYGVTDANRHIYDRMTATIISDCAAKDEWTKVKDYINEIMDPSTKADICNEHAWTLSGEGIDNEAKELELAADLSSTSLRLMSPDLKKPAMLSQSEWERNLEFSRAMYGDTYALILYKQGKYDEALEQQRNAVTTYHFNEPDMNERYVLYMDKAGKKEELLSFTEERIKEGNATAKMKEMHEKIWMNERSQAQLYDQYLSQLESAAKMKRQEEIKKKWMDDSMATNFTLKDLDGKTVSLTDLKGKTVVLDFWATWCGPCKASFPGMQDAVEHYANDKNVVFLFVDTWEKGKNIEENVRKFISDHKYPFRVLMDTGDAVVSQYKVDGIPTKFIIGPDQKVRFKSVGYSGNNEQLVEELITMIEMTRARNGVTP